MEIGSPWKNPLFAKMSLRNIDERFTANTGLQAEWLMGKMHLKAGMKLLDLGCGAGRHDIEFAKRGIDVTGVDISETMLGAVRQRTEAVGQKVSYIPRRPEKSRVARSGTGRLRWRGLSV